MVIHCIDQADRLVAVDAAFRCFATANGVPELAERALGRPLWDQFADAATVDVFRGLVAGVRRGTPLRIETRCDSPSLIRCVEMTIAPLSRDRVGFHSRLVGARFRVRPEPAADGDPVAPLEICTSCFRVDRGGWRDIEDVVAAEGLLARAALPEVSHGICADCLSAPADELRAGDLVAG